MNFMNILYRERDTQFEFLWKSTNVLAQPTGIKTLKCNMADSVENKYTMLFYEIIDKLLNNLRVRLSCIEKIEFFGRLNYEKFDMYKFKSNFPDHIISIVIRVCKREFHTGLLKNEVKVLYGSDDIKWKSPYEVLQW